MKNINAIFVLLVIFTLSTINAQSSKDKTENKKLVKSTFTVKGMTCQGCVNTVKNVIKNIDGVEESNVELKTGEATIKYNPNKTNPKSIEGKFDELPYKVIEKKIVTNTNKKVSENDKQ